jgi:hypothetical protein
MGFQIEDGTGSGRKCSVNNKNEINVKSTSAPLQHVISERDGQAYQVIGDFASINNSTHTVLHVKNTSTSKKMVITYIRMQTVDLAGGTALPSANTYWQIGTGRAVSSGGTAVTPVNMNFASANVADATATDNNPTMSGTFTEIDRYYVQSEGDQITFNKEGAIVLGTGDSIEIRIVSDHTGGTGYARLSFIYESEGQ